MAGKSNSESRRYDERRISLAASFLDGKDYAIYKTTRAGFTTSFVLAAARSGKEVLLVSPTKKIISSTMKSAGEEDLVGIYGNSECQINKRAVAKYPLLKHLPMSIPSMEKCKECKYANGCCIMDIERDPYALLKSITSAKLMAIMLSDGERAEYLRGILRDMEYVLIDEAHSLITGDVPKIPCNEVMLSSVVMKLQEFPELHSALRAWKDLMAAINPIDHYNPRDDLEKEADVLGTDRWLIREVKVPTRIYSKGQRDMYGELRKLARHQEDFGITEEEVILLRDLIDILGNNTVRLSYITTMGVGKVYVCGSIGRMNGAIKSYLRDYARNAAVIFVSGTLYEPCTNYFRDLVGREKVMTVIEPEVEQAVFPDVCNTNGKMTIYADTFRLSGNTEHKLSRLPDIIKRIKDISESKNNPSILLIAPNIDIQIRLYEALHGDFPNIVFDYYRSANTIGIESSIRIVIAVGLAEVPKNAYDCLSNSYMESQTIRVNDVHAWTWQAISRGKDPRGIELSEVYFIGVKQEEVMKVITWGTERTVLKLDERSWEVTCKEELPKPAVMAPFKQQVHKEQRKSSPFIKKIWDAETDEINLPDGLKIYALESPDPKNSKSTYIYKRDFGENVESAPKKVRCFGAIFSRPRTQEQLIITAETLDKFFRSKQSHHAVQQKYANSQGKFPYKPVATEDWNQLAFDMIFGMVTVSSYPIGEDGQTVQCAFDIDNHVGDNPALPRVNAVMDHLKELGIQPILEASGSIDSYHIHLPILRTPISNSHNFVYALYNEMKQADTGLDFKRDTEAFPKQKKADNKYGNPLRLPLSINRKTGVRSQLLDPDTNEPVDVVLITRVLELRNPEEEAVKAVARQYLPPSVIPTKKIINAEPSERTGTMRHCIVKALKKRLVGGEGHDMHIAIVREAYSAGMDREEIIHLFEGQANFNQRITARYVDFLLADFYPPWECSTLHERCSSFVDCEKCPWRKLGKEDIAESATAR